MTKNDETISHIRKIRHLISQENEHNPHKLVNYYIELQKQYPHLIQHNSQASVHGLPAQKSMEA